METLAPGLLCGYITEFGPYSTATPNFAVGWLAVCATALRMVLEQT